MVFGGDVGGATSFSRNGRHYRAYKFNEARKSLRPDHNYTGASLENRMATHSSIHAWEIRGAWQATVHGVAKESDTTQRLNKYICTED